MDFTCVYQLNLHQNTHFKEATFIKTFSTLLFSSLQKSEQKKHPDKNHIKMQKQKKKKKEI